MKEKLKEFFMQKRELLLFIGVLLVVFTTVIVVANYALKETPADIDTPVIEDPNDEDPNDPTNGEDPEEPVVEEPKVIVPINGSFVEVRIFFDTELSASELEQAVIFTGNIMRESQGVSYAKEDNSVFDVYTILPGEVINIQTDSLEGDIVTIRHDNDLISRYSSLSSVSVSIGDVLEENTVIGQAGTSISDSEAGVHVHLEVLLNDEYLNPSKIIGKQRDEITSNK